MSKEFLAGQSTDAEIDPNAPAHEPNAPAAPEPGLQVEEIEDVDALELRNALAEVGAEEPDGQLQPTQGGEAAKPNTPAAQPGVKDDGKGPGPVMIAKPRFDEVLTRSKRFEEELARERAEKLVLQQQLNASKPPAVNPQLAEIDAQIDALAQKFDDGQILYKDMKAQERTLQTQRDQIREEEIVQRATRRAVDSIPKAPNGEDGWLAEQHAQVVSDYGPYIEAVPLAMWNGVVDQVRANLEAQHGKLEGARGTAILRQEVGRYAHEHHAFFARMGGTAPIAADNGQPKPQPRPTPGNMPTPDQRRAKLELQARAAPSLSDMQRSTGSDTMLSDAQIEEMDEEAIAALPAATRNRLLGLSE